MSRASFRCSDLPMPLRGHLDVVSRLRIAGWAQDADSPDTPVSLIVSIDGQVAGRLLADNYRSDLEKASIGNGRYAFDFRPDPPLSPLKRYVVAVRREGDGEHVPGSPQCLELPTSLDPSTRDAIAQILSTVADEDELESRLFFLADQADRLRQIHADNQGGAIERQNRRQRTWSEPGIVKTSEPAEALKPRALVIDDHMPLSEHDAGSNAVLSHIFALQRIGYTVTFAPVTLRGDGAPLEAAGITCCLHPWYTSIEDVLMRQRDAFDLVYMHRVTTAAPYHALARDNQPRAKLVFSVADLHHLRLSRQAEIEGRAELRVLSELIKLKELTAAWHSDAVITHSAAEAAILRQHMRPEKIHVVPWSLMPQPTTVPFAERRGLAFIGGYRHRPNVDAALWLVDEIMPELEQLDASIPCMLVGSDMPDQLQNLRRRDVDPVGYVPALSTVFARVRLTVAPLAYGAGVKGKVLDSLAAGIPCVCTAAAAEGLNLPQPMTNLIASTPSELAHSIEALHNDEALNRSCSEAGLAYIAEHASEAKVDSLMRAVVR